jgi:hypothetical protein
LEIHTKEYLPLGSLDVNLEKIDRIGLGFVKNIVERHHIDLGGNDDLTAIAQHSHIVAGA